MIYTVNNSRSGFELLQRFENYDRALRFYRSERDKIGGPVALYRWDDEGNLDAVLHYTREQPWHE
jgi:hypothetical protein